MFPNGESSHFLPTVRRGEEPLRVQLPRFCLLAIACLFFSSPLFSAGETGFQFLSIAGGARANGMGEAQSALVEGANAMYWNPAGLGLTASNELALTHLNYLEDISEQHAALAWPIKKGRAGAWGVSLTRFLISDIETRDAQSSRVGTAEQEDSALQVSYGVRLGSGRGFERSGWFAGVGLKRVSEKIAGVTAETLAYDAGLQYRPGSTAAEKLGEWTRRLSVGLAATNLGGGAKFDRETTDLPGQTRLGFGYTHFLWGDALNLAVDAVFPKNGNMHLNEGVEFWIRNTFALRVGLVGDQDAGSGLRAGGGFRFQTIELNYAWTGFDEALGDAHRVSVDWRFGRDAQAAVTGLKSDLVKYYLTQAQDHLSAQSYHEAVLAANRVLDIDAGNPQALQLLTEAGEKMRKPDPLPEPPTPTPLEESTFSAPVSPPEVLP